MPTITPDIADDLMRLAASLSSLNSIVITAGVNRNAWPGLERPSRGGSGVAMRAQFWEVTGNGRTEPDNDSRVRWVEVQVLLRGDRNDTVMINAHARTIQDALDLFGPWTGTSGKEYMDVQAEVPPIPVPLGPGPSDAEYVSLNLMVQFSG